MTAGFGPVPRGAAVRGPRDSRRRGRARRRVAARLGRAPRSAPAPRPASPQRSRPLWAAVGRRAACANGPAPGAPRTAKRFSGCRAGVGSPRAGLGRCPGRSAGLARQTAAAGPALHRSGRRSWAGPPCRSFRRSRNSGGRVGRYRLCRLFRCLGQERTLCAC